MISGILMMALCVGFTVQAGNKIGANEKIFVAPMENGLDQFVSAEILKQKLPVTLTIDEEQAAYVLTGKSVDKGSNSKWYDVVFGTAGTRDSVQGSISLIRKSDKSIVWANAQGDRSVWWGILKRGGERKVAIRLVHRMKKDLF